VIDVPVEMLAREDERTSQLVLAMLFRKEDYRVRIAHVRGVRCAVYAGAPVDKEEVSR
jgi:hypothetical protein